MFKNLFKSKSTVEKVPEIALSADERLDIQRMNEVVNKKIKAGGDIDLAQLYDQLGENDVKLGAIDDAISAFEMSLETKEQFGTAYNNLLNLYEIKRKESAQEKK